MAALPRRLRSLGEGLKDWLKIIAPSLLILAAGFAIAFGFVKPAPPDRIVIATGSISGAYYQYAKRYADILARNQITLEIRPTAGSVENIQLLQDGAVDIAFVQGGVPEPGARTSHRLLALGSVFLEPLWVFHRQGVAKSFRDMVGRRVAIGIKGSGTSILARELLRVNGVADQIGQLLPIGGNDAAKALAAGDIDAAFFVLAPNAPVIQRLFRENGIVPMSFQRSEAYVRRYRFLSRVTLPRGAIDLASDRPKNDVDLVAPAASIVTTDRFHPALVGLLLEAAREVHARGDLISPPDAFPSTKFLDYRIDPEAKRYLTEGPSFLQRYFPFWVANLLDRTKVMLLPLIALLLPVMRILPPFYRWRVRSKVYRWYTVLTRIEDHMRSEDLRTAEILFGELDELEADVRQIRVPPSYADELYALRLHIANVRRELSERT